MSKQRNPEQTEIDAVAAIANFRAAEVALRDARADYEIRLKLLNEALKAADWPLMIVTGGE